MAGAYLTFKRSFIRDFKDQMVDERNPGGVGVSTVTGTYRLLALIFIGEKRRWLDLFDPTSEVSQAKLKTDKSDAFRIFAWFILTFVFSFIAWLQR